MKATPESAPHGGYTEGALFLVLSLALFAYSLISHQRGPAVSWALSPYLFPLLISVFLFLLSGVLLLKARRGGRQKAEHSPINWRIFFMTAGAASAYCLLMPLLGFVTATALFLCGMFYALGERRPLFLLLLPPAFAAISYLLFAKALYVMLPSSSIDILRLGLDALMGG